MQGLLQMMLGSWGGPATEFYLANQLWINSLILGYGFLVVLGRHNYNQILNFIVEWLDANRSDELSRFDQTGEDENDSADNETAGDLIAEIELPWEESLQVARLPFIVEPGKFIPHYSSTGNLKKLIHPRAIFKAWESLKDTTSS